MSSWVHVLMNLYLCGNVCYKYDGNNKYTYLICTIFVMCNSDYPINDILWHYVYILQHNNI